MKLSLSWAEDFVKVADIDTKNYCDVLTDTGSKVEGYEILGEEITNVRVGKIEKIEKHPDSDHLLVCQLDVGEGKLRQICTGAQNVFEGAYVPVCVPPCTLPGGKVIKDGKLRGVESFGMLCSGSELGLDEHDYPGANDEGILILEGTPAVGTDIKELLMISDRVVEFEITSNRPDCLSVIGLARETAVSYSRELNVPTPTVTEADGNISDYLSVGIDAPDLCKRYCARVIKNVKIERSPLWMRARLRASGVRPINNIVDITNYVMLEYGQPMHAFDYAMLDGNKICVRRASEGENFRSLDSVDHTLNANTLVIADEKKAVALAGVMGGENSEIKDSTVTVVFESANFDGASVRIAAKSQGMRTESSSRFEKGLDPENAMAALNRACELVTLLGAGEVVCGCIDLYPGKAPLKEVAFDYERINKFLGVELTREYMVSVLEKLGCKVNGDVITVPSFRSDLAMMNDIAEEVIRIYGYNKIESTPFKCSVKAGTLTPMQAYKERLHTLLTSMGADESMTFSFVSKKDSDLIRLPEDAPERRYVEISNPLGEDTSVMRTSLIPSLMGVLERANSRHLASAKMYELGFVYLPSENEGELPTEKTMLVLGFFGEGDFYDLKGMTENILEDAGVKNVRFTAQSANPTFHPGRCADITARGGKTFIGTIGQIHPLCAKNYGISAPVYLAYIDFDTLFAVSDFEKHYKALPKYPSSTRDFAFVCDRSLEVGSITEVIKRADKMIESVTLFDIYTGDKIDADKKSTAFRVVMRAQDHTLTVEESDKVSAKILAALEKQLGITLRA